MKSIVIYSGGLDSTVLLCDKLMQNAMSQGQVKALSFNYGQRHSRELMRAQEICYRLGIEHQVIDLTSIKPLLKGSSQTDINIPVPHGHYAEESMKATVVSNRNMIMLAIAGAWAISSKFDEVAYAAHAGDHAIYPDCRESFVKPLSEALENADWHKVRIARPFLLKTKAEIVALGNLISAPLAMTYSCYEGAEIHCGKCGTCVERREAFRDAGVPDPTLYKE